MIVVASFLKAEMFTFAWIFEKKGCVSCTIYYFTT